LSGQEGEGNRQQAWGFDTIFDFAADKADNYGTISFDPKTGPLPITTGIFSTAHMGRMSRMTGRSDRI
jgi:hypothetical protein